MSMKLLALTKYVGSRNECTWLIGQNTLESTCSTNRLISLTELRTNKFKIKSICGGRQIGRAHV